ncbi:MAG TPA: hypothetical protein VF541_12760 [Longimicrobium sp.]
MRSKGGAWYGSVLAVKKGFSRAGAADGVDEGAGVAAEPAGAAGAEPARAAACAQPASASPAASSGKGDRSMTMRSLG